MPAPNARRRVARLAPALVVTVSLAAIALGACGGDESTSAPPGGAGGTGGNGGTSAGAAGALGGSAGSTAGTGGSSGASAGGSSGASAGGSSGASAGGAGGAKNDPACPAALPTMGDACVGELVCPSYYSDTCDTYDYASCKGGHWYTKRGLSAKCNPPAPCPEEEPDPAAAECPKYGIAGSGAICRYARQTCFVYLACFGSAPTPWKERAFGDRPADSCCPAVKPTLGSTCTDEAILCQWDEPSVELECRTGLWTVRGAKPGVGGGS